VGHVPDAGYVRKKEDAGAQHSVRFAQKMLDEPRTGDAPHSFDPDGKFLRESFLD
jgi:hypothetical protein